MRVRNYIGIGIRCIHCGSFLKQHINIFFDGDGKDEKDIICPTCRKRIFTIEKDGRNYKLEALCASCGDRHRFVVPVREAIHTPEKRFICKVTGVTTLILGMDNNIESYMENCLEKEIKSASYDERNEASIIFDTIAKAGGVFADDRELFECLEKFKELSGSNRINCECGDNLIQLLVEEDGFRVICSTCERDMFFDFTTREGVEKIKKLSDIFLK